MEVVQTAVEALLAEPAAQAYKGQVMAGVEPGAVPQVLEKA